MNIFIITGAIVLLVIVFVMVFKKKKTEHKSPFKKIIDACCGRGKY